MTDGLPVPRSEPTRDAVSPIATTSRQQSNVALMPRTRFQAVVVATVLGALPLLWAAALNGYPFVFPDTGAYVVSGMALSVPIDRPALYGLWLRFTSLQSTLWLSAGAQALLVSALIVSALKVVGQVRRLVLCAPLATALLAACSGVAVVSPALMPDVFGGVMLLSAALLVASPSATLNMAALAVVLLLSLVVHNSHPPILAAALVPVVAWRALAWRHAASVSWRGIALAAVTVLAAPISVSLAHRAISGRAVVAEGAGLFYAARMAHTGFLDEYLADACPTHASWQLCLDRGSIPRDAGQFLWGTYGAVERFSGRPEILREMNEVVRGSFREPRWITRHLRDALWGGGAQLWRISSEEMLKTAPGNTPDALRGPAGRAIAAYFPGDASAFARARQSRGAMALDPVEPLHAGVVGASALVISTVLLARRRRLSAPLFAFAAVIVGGFLANALVCGALSIPTDRYGARLAWLLPLTAALLVARSWRSVRGPSAAADLAA
jgi:hypothetical protein